MTDNELAFVSATELKELIASKKVSPVEIMELYFSRIEQLDSRLNAYLALNRDEAMKMAKAAEDGVIRGDKLGILHGLPISIKDLELSKDITTTSGSLIFKCRVPEEDSVVVDRVRRAGATILGKTNTPEFGLLGTTENLLSDDCRNPWDIRRTSGGSSGGAGASVVAGLCSLATGSDGGGSIRIPASFCGVYGIKPTQGRVPRYVGMQSTAPANYFSQSGPMSRTVSDSALLLQALSGYDSKDPTSLREPPPDFLSAVSRGVKGLRILWSPNYGYAAVDSEVAEVTYKAARVFEDLGCSVEESTMELDSPFEAFWTVFSANAYAGYKYLLEEQANQLTWYARECIEYGSTVSGADYAIAQGYIEGLKAKVADQFEECSLLLSPTMAVPAFPVGQPPTNIGGKEVDPVWGFLPFTYPINMTGNPAANVPCGFSSDHMPIGLHIVGRKGDEETVIAASAAFEKAKPWTQHRPPVS